jgi:Holliday junction resolvase RusA-like endonuclease
VIPRADPVTVVLLGEPVAWARAAGGRTRALFTPKKQRNNAAALKIAAQQEMLSRGQPPFACALVGQITAEMAIPSSWSKKKQISARLGNIWPAKRPDLSNICKQIEDALNGVVFVDDALIVRYDTMQKRYSDQPKIVVTYRPA